MIPQSFIFIGRSGCGKGTQVELLIKALKEKDPARDILHIETGKELREFINGPTFTQIKSKEIYDKGGLQPEFLPVYLWIKVLSEKYTGNEHLIFDGTPRRFHEAGVLNSIFDFYNLSKPWLVNIEISSEEALKRLLARKRIDDNEEDIKERLSWYETEVVPTLSYYDGNPKYNFLKIFGERSVEEIHKDIMERLNNSTI
ncbi:MAG: nucleoside monophosphate kinase [Candidatus Paceibacterota bacterium]|jgi:adenylate kinase